jgi:predicted metal-dependent hydrolase
VASLSRTGHNQAAKEPNRVLQTDSIMACAASLSEQIGFPIGVAMSTRATRMGMRIDPATGGVKVTLPTRASLRSFQSFVTSHEGWIRVHAGKLPDRVRLVPGSEVPVLGVDHRIVQDTSARFPTCFAAGADGPEILVGKTEFPENRVIDFLRAEAHKHFAVLTREKAAQIGQRLASVTVKDTTSRWGSCTHDGHINYSWRIIMAPPEIADYLVAHEVSHLAEMNHGPRFWRLCRTISGIPPDRADAWLKRNSQRLHRYGPA